MSNPVYDLDAEMPVDTYDYAPRSIYVSGNYAYLGCFQSFSTVDISDPTSPTFVDKLTFASNISTGVFVSSPFALE